MQISQKAICDKLGYELQIEDMEFDSIIAKEYSQEKADFGAKRNDCNRGSSEKHRLYRQLCKSKTGYHYQKVEQRADK